MSSYEALRTKAAVIDLSGRGVIRATGEDRARLLHGMCTNHITGLEEGHGVYAFFLTAQGRIIADSFIYNFGSSLLLDTEPELRTKLMEHLDRYIIADDVELQDESGQWRVAGVEGPASLYCASAIGIPLPDEDFGVTNWQSGFVARGATTGPTGLRVFVPPSDFPALLERFGTAGIPLASPEEAESVRVENGVPRYGSDISERHLVQETGLLHGVHPNKGCYVGQEIVERVRTQAQIHRHLRRLRIDGSETPLPGSKLLLHGKDVGEVTSATFSSALGSVLALGYVRTEAVDAPLEVAGAATLARVL